MPEVSDLSAVILAISELTSADGPEVAGAALFTVVVVVVVVAVIVVTVVFMIDDCC